MADPVVGSVLGGKYLVEGILGQGGMGVVVAARHVDLDQRVAIKCLLAHAQAVPEIVERFTREARAAAKIQGEHVARVIDVGRFDDGTPFMVMEHLTGRDLAEELAAVGPLPVHDAVRYVLEACEALVQAHALRIVHRDLKPANMFLTAQPGRRPIVKVLDFGISKVIDPSGSSLTKTASVMGTPYYMSPEQLLSSKSVDERSDIWALGVILYELLAGRTPFYAETAPEVVALVLQNAPEPLALKRPDMPLGLADVVARCMRNKVDERFANVAELAHALAPFAAIEDQGSAHAISRVLGVAGPAPSNVPYSALAGQASAGSYVATAATQAGRASGHGAQPGTAHNLAVSSPDVPAPPKSRAGVVAAIAAAVAVAAIGGFAVLRKAPAPEPAAAATPSPAAVVSAALSAAQQTAPVGLAPVEPPGLPAIATTPPSALAAQAVSAAAQVAAAAAGGGHGAKHAAAGAPPGAPPKPASGPAQPPAPAPAPSPAAPAPAAPAAVNPLDMHIK
jgi:serine/threonine-protein kinase